MIMPQWNLTRLYTSLDDDKLQQDLQESVQNAKNIQQKFSPLLQNPHLEASTFRLFLEETEKILNKGYIAFQFANLSYASCTSDQKAQRAFSKALDAITEIDAALSFWKPMMSEHDDTLLQALMDSSQLTEYRHVLQILLESKKHILKENEERLLSTFSNSSRKAFGNLYDAVTNAYEFQITLDGKEQTMTGPQIRSLRLHSDATVRRESMKTFFQRYTSDKIVLEKSYNAIVKHYDTESRIRGFAQPIHMRNLDNEVDNSIVDTLIQTTSDHTHVLQNYYEWKSKQLGISLTLADIYAPLKPMDTKISFDEAKNIVLKAYHQFDPEIGAIAASFFEDDRIDSDIRKGKRGGAFCSYIIPNRKPFVLLNYTGTMRDVMTLAHELGHGIHGTLSSEQSFWNYHTPLTMAEVASVFGEMIVMDSVLPMLQQEEKNSFIASKIEDMFATMFRQNMFCRFEIASHKAVQENGSANWEELSKIYHQELQQVFGSSVEIPEEYTKEWASIPHIFNVPFYVYAYNFANLLVIALYQKFKEEGSSFVPMYKNLLRSGGKQSPKELLSQLGIQLDSADFWNKGFAYVSDNLIQSLQ
jgi:oligoendopeptidase F